MGAAISELLLRLGVRRLILWDADTVAPHNMGNQFFRNSDIGKKKNEALAEILKTINPEVEIELKGFCTVSEKVTGYIFLCIDNIDVRRELCTKWKTNPLIKFICDGRMGLTSGNIYTADWSHLESKKNLIASMQYTHEEVLAETPVSACGLTLSVVITPRVVAALMVSNWIKFVNTKTYKRMMQVDGYAPFLESFEG